VGLGYLEMSALQKATSEYWTFHGNIDAFIDEYRHEPIFDIISSIGCEYLPRRYRYKYEAWCDVLDNVFLDSYSGLSKSCDKYQAKDIALFHVITYAITEAHNDKRKTRNVS
jgi:hypothetical protein